MISSSILTQMKILHTQQDQFQYCTFHHHVLNTFNKLRSVHTVQQFKHVHSVASTLILSMLIFDALLCTA